MPGEPTEESVLLSATLLATSDRIRSPVSWATLEPCWLTREIHTGPLKHVSHSQKVTQVPVTSFPYYIRQGDIIVLCHVSSCTVPQGHELIIAVPCTGGEVASNQIL